MEASMYAFDERHLAIKAKLFRGFADRSRLRILEALRGRALTVGEIVEATGLSQPNVSNHLGCLRDCGLVRREPRGRHAVYRLSDERIERLLQWAEALLEETAHGVASCPNYDEAESRAAAGREGHGGVDVANA